MLLLGVLVDAAVQGVELPVHVHLRGAFLLVLIEAVKGVAKAKRPA
jgi:hypothetical protein